MVVMNMTRNGTSILNVVMRQGVFTGFLLVKFELSCMSLSKNSLGMLLLLTLVFDLILMSRDRVLIRMVHAILALFPAVCSGGRMANSI